MLVFLSFNGASSALTVLLILDSSQASQRRYVTASLG